MFEQSEKIQKPTEKILKLEQEACCALERAFRQNPQVTKELAEMVGVEEMRKYLHTVVFGMSPERRSGSHFAQSNDKNIVYSQIAKRELERIEAEDEDDSDLKC